MTFVNRLKWSLPINSTRLYSQDSFDLQDGPNASAASQGHEDDDETLLKNDHRCAPRHDTSGPWNILQTYFMFILHLLSCIIFVLCLTESVNGRKFRPGSPPSSIFTWSSPLYQTQVNGLLSLALVFVRMMAACCTAQLLWTATLVLLERRGLTFVEISRLINYRIPFKIEGLSRTQIMCFVWGVIVLLLLWPSGFAAPVANSSLAWDPIARDYDSALFMSLPSRIGVSRNYWAVQTPKWQMGSLLQSVVWSGSSPEYISVGKLKLMRRYFQRPANMTNDSIVDIELPFFEVSIRWIDPAADPLSVNITNTEYSDYVGSRDNGLSRIPGSVVIMGRKPWDRLNDYPTEERQYVEERLIGVHVKSGYKFINHNRTLEDNYTTFDPDYVVGLPNLKQKCVENPIDKWTVAVDCYQIGIATIRAASTQGKDCEVKLIGSNDASATCDFTRNIHDTTPDWAAPVATNMVSEILKAVVLLGYTTPWKGLSLDDYTTNAMTLGYHAAWSAAVNLHTLTQSNSYRPAIPRVRANVDKSKLLAWLFMNLAVTISGVIVYIGLRFSDVKFVRDTTITSLKLNLCRIIHHPLTEGLCDAVAVAKEDRHLPKLRLMANSSGTTEESASSISFCRRRVVFVDTHGVEIE